MVTLEIPLKGTSGKLFIRYLFEGRKISRKLSLQEAENNARLQTEATSLGKFGRGIQSQVTGLGHQVTGLGSKLGGVFKKEKSVKKAQLEEHPSAVRVSKLDHAIPSLPAKDKNISTSNLPAVVANIEVDAEKDKTLKRSAISNGTLSKSGGKVDADSGLGTAEISPPSPTLSRYSTASVDDTDHSHDVEVHILGGKDLKSVDSNGTSDPYVRVTLQGRGDKRVHKTTTVKKSLNPTWADESFHVSLTGPAVRFTILDKNMLLSSVSLGHVVLDPSTLLDSKDLVSEWFKIQDGTGFLHVSFRKLSNEEIQKRSEGGLKKKKAHHSSGILNFLKKK